MTRAKGKKQRTTPQIPPENLRDAFTEYIEEAFAWPEVMADPTMAPAIQLYRAKREVEPQTLIHLLRFCIPESCLCLKFKELPASLRPEVEDGCLLWDSRDWTVKVGEDVLGLMYLSDDEDGSGDVQYWLHED